MIRDRNNDASIRQKLDPISKNILRRKNPLEVVFEGKFMFDAENPIVESLLKEIDLNKKQIESDFIKSLPSRPGNEFEIQKKLDRLDGIKWYNNKKSNDNNNNNNNNNDGLDFFPPCPPGPNDNNRNDLGSIPSFSTFRDLANPCPSYLKRFHTKALLRHILANFYSLFQ